MKKVHLTLLLALSITTIPAFALRCKPSYPASCYSSSDCNCNPCLGPYNQLGNAPVCPHTCGSDFIFEASGLCWKVQEEGLDYAVDILAKFPQGINPLSSSILALNQLQDAKYHSPHFDWNWGAKLGLSYCSPCDGWDLGFTWTTYKGRGQDEVSFDSEDESQVLLPLWSCYSRQEGPLFATQILTRYNLQLNIYDFELGREFWTSRYVTVRPFIAIRGATIDQCFQIEHNGGSWEGTQAAGVNIPPYINQVTFHNDFAGAGIRCGWDSVWNVGCGWGLYGNFALALLYGSFTIEHDERNREATTPFAKNILLDTEHPFSASRAIADAALGIQYHTLICDCRYGFTMAFGYEQHVFFNQNQLWRVVRMDKDFTATPTPLNTSGQNLFTQTRGSLTTHGFTFTLKFDF